MTFLDASFSSKLRPCNSASVLNQFSYRALLPRASFPVLRTETNKFARKCGFKLEVGMPKHFYIHPGHFNPCRSVLFRKIYTNDHAPAHSIFPVFFYNNNFSVLSRSRLSLKMFVLTSPVPFIPLSPIPFSIPCRPLVQTQC